MGPEGGPLYLCMEYMLTVQQDVVLSGIALALLYFTVLR